MKVIPPKEVTPTLLTSNVAITETEWTAGTYNTGDQRYVDTTLYEVVADPSTTDSPTDGVLADPPTWIEIGSINRFKMFDFVIGDATQQSSGDIDVTISADGSWLNGVALFELDAESVQVRMIDSTEGVVYDETRDLLDDSNVSSWDDYFFNPILSKREVVVTDLPAYVDADINIVISANGGDVECGECVVGTVREFGFTLQDFEFRIEDFSRKERNTFGQFTVVEKDFAKTSDYDIWLNNGEVNGTYQLLTSIRATPSVYVGADDFLESVTFGFYQDFQTLRTGPNSSEMTLRIEGIV